MLRPYVRPKLIESVSLVVEANVFALASGQNRSNHSNQIMMI
jgi:hypothetical protein